MITANTQNFDGHGHELVFDNLNGRMDINKNAEPIIMENYVWVGINVIILGGVTIRKGSVIAAGSVVTKSL